MNNLKKENTLYTTGIAITLIFSVIMQFNWVLADTATTAVVVANSAPTFGTDAYETTAVTTAAPVNTGSDVSFSAISDDPNANSYYLVVCSTDAISTTTGGGSATCDVATWGTSTSTTDLATSTATYTTTGSEGCGETCAWYAYVCDTHATNQKCTAASQGTGDSGSAFYVNHAPAFTVITPTASVAPGGTVTFTATASDADTSGTADTVKLVVCKTEGVTGTSCTGTEYCSSSLTASNPTCDGTVAIPAEGSQNYYPYVFDSHDMAATGSIHGVVDTYTATNVAPVVSSVSLNSGTAITLTTESSTTDISITATITDNNGCADIDSGASDSYVDLYRSGIGRSSCDANAEDDNNNCYAEVDCLAPTGCEGGTDLDVAIICTVPVQYHADPTDESTIYVAENWTGTVVGKDEALDHEANATAAVELNSFSALDVTSAIDYTSLNVGELADATVLPQTVTVTATGNTGIDVELSGINMTDSGNTIVVGAQKYGTTAVEYQNGIALTDSAVELELNCAKTTTSGSAATSTVYWGLQIPNKTVTGTYSGTITFGAVKGESANW